MKQNQPDPVKPPKKKRVLSEEHKAKLASAREKALATRKRNAEEKKRVLTNLYREFFATHIR